MPPCQSCQELLLDYLYDLLEPTERADLDGHLAGCPACQTALAAVRLQRDRLATAARLEFPAVRFAAPVEAAPVTPITVVPLPTPAARPRRHWARYAAAAAVVVALAGVGAPAAWFASDYAAARQRIADRDAALARADADARKAREDLTALAAERQRQIDAIHDGVRARQLQVAVTGPETYQPGAPGEYRIRTTDGNGRPAPARVTVSVVDLARNNEKIATLDNLASDQTGNVRVTLPADLPVKPQGQPVLVVDARRDGGIQTELSEQLQLAAPVYLTHLTTDKPLYQPGEAVYFRSLTLDRNSLKPAQDDLRFSYLLRKPSGEEKVILRGVNGLHDPKTGSDVIGPDGKPVRGIGAGAFPLDPNDPGGEYILTVREDAGRFAEQQRKFVVNKYQKPRLNKELDYNRKTYGPGDEVVATVKANKADGGAVANTDVLATVTIDDVTYGADGKLSNKPIKFRTDNQGAVKVRFKLPTAIEKGRAALTVQVQDETLVKPISIVLKKLQVEFFPEGGDLVADLPNRVYFQARTMLDKPADLKGVILEDGRPIAQVETLTDDKEPGVNQGLGRFELTPKAGRKYELEIGTPAGIAKKFELPAIKPDGVVLRLTQDVIGANEPIRVKVHSSKPRTLMVGAYCRGRLLDATQLEKGQTAAELKPTGGAGGVCRVTVFEVQPGDGQRRDLKPVAERLVYRKSAEEVVLTLRPDRAAYVPGQKASVTIETRDEKEEAAPAIVMVAVVDKSVLALADEKTARTMPTHFLLTSEVRKPDDLEYADFLMGPHKKAAEALDLLLGTQGWRRFAEQNPAEFLNQFKEHEARREAERLLVTMGQGGPRTTDFVEKDIARVRDEMETRKEEVLDRWTTALTARDEASADPSAAAAVTTIARYQDLFAGLRRVGVLVLTFALTLGMLACLLAGVWRNTNRAPFYVWAAACGMLAFVLSMQLLPRMHMPEAAGGREMAMRQDEAKNAALDDRAEMKRAAADMEREAMMPKDAARPAPPPRAPGADGDKPGDPRGPFDRPDVALRPGGPKDGGFAPGAVPPGPGGGIGWGTGAPGGFGGGNKKEGGRFGQFGGGGFGGFDPGRDKGKGDEAKGEGKAGDGKAGVGYFNPLAGRRGDALDANQLRRKQLLEQMDWDQKGGGGGKDGRGGQEWLPPTVVREYAHTRSHGADPELRSDFSETLYWHPVLVFPKGTGQATFELCDSVTSFQVTAFAHTLDGRLGAATKVIESRLPLALQPKVPLEVTATDEIDLPVAVNNNTGGKLPIRLNLTGHEGLALLRGEASEKADAPFDSPLRRIFRFKPTVQEGEAVVTFEAKADGLGRDAVRNTFRVVPDGFPVVGSHSDVLEQSATAKVTLPKSWVPDTLRVKASVYPSTLADLQKGLEGLLREPHGCFEQTSTSNYPNLLILDYLRESDQNKPEVEKRARELLAKGYQKLTSFECMNSGKNSREGYEWFGGTAPPHEALTAYGLLQFRDMARVQDVDEGMVKRTRDYLMARKDGNGGFQRNQRALDTFGRAPQDITDAYIVWSLTESGTEDDVTKELDALHTKAKASKDPYFLSLVANSLINRAKTAEGTALLKTVAGMQKDDGHLEAVQTSITGSGGRDLQIETTALAVLGWLKAQPGTFNEPVRKAVGWIGKQRGGQGSFGSTQSTILALKALIAYTKANKRPAEAGELTLYVNDVKVNGLKFDDKTYDLMEIEVPSPEKFLKPGENKLRLEVTGKSVFPCTLSWTYQTLQPSNAEGCPVKVATKLSKTDVTEGESVRLSVAVENVSGKGQGMAVAVVGLPAGLQVPEDLKQLKEYTRTAEDATRPLVGAFEIRGRELVLYWRDLEAGQKIEVPVDLICRVPGTYRGPASRSYLYYNADLKYWVEPLSVKIAAKAE